MEKIFHIRPAFDKRPGFIVGPTGDMVPDGKPDYGIHCAELILWLTGERGGVSFLMSTGWYLPDTRANFKIEKFTIGTMLVPKGYDLSVHSSKPLPADDNIFRGTHDKCELVNNKHCYYSSSAINAIPVAELLVSEGLDAVWKYLEDYYVQTFGELK